MSNFKIWRLCILAAWMRIAVIANNIVYCVLKRRYRTNNGKLIFPVIELRESQRENEKDQVKYFFLLTWQTSLRFFFRGVLLKRVALHTLQMPRPAVSCQLG